jgi:hypothetical protein
MVDAGVIARCVPHARSSCADVFNDLIRLVKSAIACAESKMVRSPDAR